MSWEKVKLSEVAKLVTGKTPPTINQEYFNGDLLWINPSDFTGKILESSKRTLTAKAVFDKKCNVLPKGSLLLSCIGDIGKVGILSREGTSNQQITALILNDKIHPEYLYYYLLLSKPKLENLANKAVVAILNNERLKELEIPLQPLHIQHHIANVLDKADALRQKDQQLLKKYDELAQSIFYDMFGDPVKNEKGWEVKKLEYSVTIKPESILPENSSELNYVGLEHIEKETGNILTESPSVDVLKSNKFKFNENHILYGKLRPYLNKVALPDFSGICSTDILPISCKANSDKYFISFIIKSKHFVEYATSLSVGANLPRANKETVYSYETICPPLKFQNEFSKKVRLIASQKQLVMKNANQNNDLFTSLLDKYFN